MKITNPENPKWLIIWNDERNNIIYHGSVLPMQKMETKWEQVDTYTDEVLWLNVLLKNGVETDLLEL